MAYAPANRNVKALSDVEPFHEHSTAEVFGTGGSINHDPGFIVSFLGRLSLPPPVGTQFIQIGKRDSCPRQEEFFLNKANVLQAEEGAK